MGARLSENTYQTRKCCPSCRSDFDSEKLLAKKFSPKAWDLSLRNIYEPVPAVEPLLYFLVTCPNCLFTASEGDFDDPKIGANKGIAEAGAQGKAVLDLLSLKPADFARAKDYRVGLAQYYLAELWYDARVNLPIRRFRLGMTLYRRSWLLEKAVAERIISPDHGRNDLRYCLLGAESNLEQSYLSERLPENLFCGPDYGANFGQAALPYIIAWTNFQMAVDRSESTDAERVVHFRKSAKFLGLVGNALARGGSLELRNKIADLRVKLKEAESGLPPSEPETRPVAAAPKKAQIDKSARPPAAKSTPVAESGFRIETEMMEWELQFDALMDQFGEVYEPGATVIAEGEDSTDLFLIIEGKVHVVKTYARLSDKATRLIAILGRGSFFGEMSLLDHAPRSASVLAAEKTSVIRINDENLKSIIAEYPSIAIRIMTVLARRLRNYDAFVQAQLVPMLASDDTPKRGSSRRPDIRTNITIELEGLLQEVRDRAY